MPFFNLPLTTALGALLIFIRVVGIFISAPVLSSARIPPHTKVGLAILIALVLQPVVGLTPLTLPGNVLSYLALVVKEAVVGVSIGFVANMVFSAVQMAGEIADLQTGYAFAGLVDPYTGERTSMVGQFQVMMAWLVFLAVNGHHLLLKAVADSFQVLPLGSISVNEKIINGVMSLSSHIFLIALQIGAPIIGAVLLADLALGLLARTVPQLNILVIGFPIKMVMGLIVLMLALPLTIALQQNLVHVMKDGMAYVMSFVTP